MFIKKLTAAILITAAICVTLSACQKDAVNPPVDVTSDESSQAIGTEEEATEPAINITEESEPETLPDEIAPVTVEETTAEEPEPDATEPETEPIVEPVVTEPAETQAPTVMNSATTGYPLAPRLTDNFVSMLTGLPTTKTLYYQRPVAIMINNIKKSLPQWGIGKADVIYECTVEGALTRLMAVFSDYSGVDVIGSVRSSREYYLDFAANHNAIYVHAGGSTEAYEQISQRRVNNLDGVNMYLPNCFYRDQYRKLNMGYEHSLMTTGANITASIKYKGYQTEVYDFFDSSFKFVDYNAGATNPMTGGVEAKHIIITYTSSHFPQYIYNSKNNTYKRYQYNGIAHVDAATGEQLEFTNLLVLSVPHSSTGDSYNHINVNTVGSGSGYYISGGKCINITWEKKNLDVPMVLYNSDGSLLKMNCGKTFVNIVSSTAFSGVVLNYKR